MQEKFRKAFFAFPAQGDDLVATITSGAKAAEAASNKVSIKLWPQMDVFGAGIADEVRDNIRGSDVLVCDVTRPNLNVYYEIGFAIGAGKPVAPVINASYADAVQDLLKDGFFDGIGFKAYENSEQLARILVELPKHVLLELYGSRELPAAAIRS